MCFHDCRRAVVEASGLSVVPVSGLDQNGHPTGFPSLPTLAVSACCPLRDIPMQYVPQPVGSVRLCVLTFGVWLALGVPLAAQDSAQRNQGQAIYAKSCAGCHGDQGQGVKGTHEDPLTGDRSVVELADLIDRTMPEGEPDKCTGEEASAVAAFLHNAFYSEAARIRNDPPRIRLTRLTGTQLRQSLADLYGHFAGSASSTTERGLKGEYFTGSRPNNDKRKIERVDSTIDFDWKQDGPGEGVDAKDFSIRWRGGLKVLESGRYEIVVRSSCAFLCGLGRNEREFINNRVQSGDRTEFRKSVTLTAGRVYPIQIELYQRKRKTEQPPATISLSWVPPHSTEVLIPERSLVPVYVPPAFSLQTKLPPDDRSYGFERGLAIDRQWDESTTASAAEFAQMAVDELWPIYRQRHKNDSDENRARLRGFLTELVETAFRGPLDESSRQFYIDAQMAQAEGDAEATKRCLLVTLKSPRFLYPALDQDRSTSQRAANRLALTLFDSLPSDEWLIRLAREDKLQTADQIRQAAQRMLDDDRAHGKIREFMSEWLNLSHFTDLVKSGEKFPGFTPEIVADLKASLDASIDEIVRSDSSDFRQLFLSTRLYTTPRLQQYYGAEWKPADSSSGLSQSGTDLKNSAGLLSHPYLMSGLAYQDSTSPIHRGVFLIRNVLGRTLNPPKEAFTPLSPDLHPDLTTRQRIEKQTSPNSCQTCHLKINGLGFALENFDADGRFREKESDRTIDATGHYVTREGQPKSFRGASELAGFLASSHDVHRAFVNRAFQHFVKQPVAAYGLDQLDELTGNFQRDGFHIRRLLVEIATIAATQTESSPTKGQKND